MQRSALPRNQLKIECRLICCFGVLGDARSAAAAAKKKPAPGPPGAEQAAAAAAEPEASVGGGGGGGGKKERRAGHKPRRWSLDFEFKKKNAVGGNKKGGAASASASASAEEEEEEEVGPRLPKIPGSPSLPADADPHSGGEPELELEPETATPVAVAAEPELETDAAAAADAHFIEGAVAEGGSAEPFSQVRHCLCLVFPACVPAKTVPFLAFIRRMTSSTRGKTACTGWSCGQRRHQSRGRGSGGG